VLTAFPPIFLFPDPVECVFAHWTSRDVKASNESNADPFKSHQLEAYAVVWVVQSLKSKREADTRPVIRSRSVVVRIGRIVVRVIVVGAVIDIWPIVASVAIAAMAISVPAFLRLVPVSLPTRFGSS